MKKIDWTELLIFIVSAELIGAVSALLSGGFGSYLQLVKPPLSPPGWLFPVVWAILYAVMGISAYFVYKSDSELKKAGSGIYILQLSVNFLWSIIFFRFGWLNAAAFAAVLLTVLVVGMILIFLRIDKKAGLMNIPYFVWCLFASYLAIGTSILN